MLLDTYLAVLTDKKNVDETRLPLDKVTGIIKDEILPIVDGQGKLGDRIPFRELSPTYQMNKSMNILVVRLVSVPLLLIIKITY